MSPRTRNNFRARGGSARGLSLVEVMFSLVIAAGLLTAAAVAFNASSDVIQANDQFSRGTQAARVSLHQILTHVRRGSVNTTWDSQTLRLITEKEDDGSGEQDLTFKYVPASKQLKLITNGVVSDPDYVLANNVSAMTFAAEIGQDHTLAPCVVRVTVHITVSVGGNSVTLSGSAAPRRNLVY
jgi:type II secretory pathway pseudopilin PulG